MRERERERGQRDGEIREWRESLYRERTGEGRERERENMERERDSG